VSEFPRSGGQSVNDCAYHRGRAGVERLGGGALCDECARARAQAVRSLGPGVPRAECCVTRSAAGEWTPLREHAASHWLSHEIGARALPGADTCAGGAPFRLHDLLRQRRPLPAGTPVASGDLWVDLDRSHAGRVVGVDRRDGVRVLIRHLCPVAGSVTVDDFHERFAGRGEFFR